MLCLSDYGQQHRSGDVHRTGSGGGDPAAQPPGRAGRLGGRDDPLGPVALGDSIAVDGVCLTAAELLGDGFRADVSEETLARTGLAAKAAAGAG